MKQYLRKNVKSQKLIVLVILSLMIQSSVLLTIINDKQSQSNNELNSHNNSSLSQPFDNQSTINKSQDNDVELTSSEYDTMDAFRKNLKDFLLQQGYINDYYILNNQTVTNPETGSEFYIYEVYIYVQDIINYIVLEVTTNQFSIGLDKVINNLKNNEKLILKQYLKAQPNLRSEIKKTFDDKYPTPPFSKEDNNNKFPIIIYTIIAL